MIRRVFVSCLFLLLGSTVWVGCGRTPTVIQTDGQRGFAAAVRLYQSGCITCHGTNLQGGIGPSLAHVGSRLSESQIAHRIDEGGGPMPGYGPDNQAILTRSQIEILATWLATKK